NCKEKASFFLIVFFNLLILCQKLLIQRYNGLSQLRSAKNPNLPRPTHPVLSTPWLAAIDQCLIPCLSPGETVIMDNASFHKSKGVKEAIEDAGCHLLFLPPLFS
ncbi:hypothetical protein X973_14630, partial [Piscirickettsia salmonis]